MKPHALDACHCTMVLVHVSGARISQQTWSRCVNPLLKRRRSYFGIKPTRPIPMDHRRQPDQARHVDVLTRHSREADTGPPAWARRRSLRLTPQSANVGRITARARVW
jgi:hypothetical protein